MTLAVALLQCGQDFMGHRQTMRILIDLGRLIIFILLLPIAIILIGPLLVLAVFRGQQRMGPIVLNSSRYDIVGRIGILMLGLAIWLLVWSGLLWFALLATSPSVLVGIPFIGPNISELIDEPTPTVVLPTVRVVTSPSVTPTAQPETSPEVSPTIETISPTSTPSVTKAATQVINTPTPELSPAPTSTTRSTRTVTAAPTSLGQPSFTSADEESVIETITEANLLLQNAITLPSEENLANLGVIWQDRALTKVERFATEQYERYRKPFSAQFEFIISPTISEEGSDQIIVTSRERWSYGGVSNTNEESFDFVYTLIQKDDRWVIIYYSYRNLPSPTPANVSPTGTVTVTPTIQN